MISELLSLLLCSKAAIMERGSVKKTRAPFDPTSIALPASFRFGAFAIGCDKLRIPPSTFLIEYRRLTRYSEMRGRKSKVTVLETNVIMPILHLRCQLQSSKRLFKESNQMKTRERDCPWTAQYHP